MPFAVRPVIKDIEFVVFIAPGFLEIIKVGRRLHGDNIGGFVIDIFLMAQEEKTGM